MRDRHAPLRDLERVVWHTIAVKAIDISNSISSTVAAVVAAATAIAVTSTDIDSGGNPPACLPRTLLHAIIVL